MTTIASRYPIVAENEPLDAWDEEETILTPDGDEEVNKNVNSFVAANQLQIFSLHLTGGGDRRW